ncbi:hypothetical protein L6164_011770 [Bauhinia variegata]|uniref:Uncharacterized protein n=1 Tax=Bauhinia variegata TaxID=167791 RepID=A0ACB9P856_BAUVA|nr:hypothetical protein L6164_011770 [Bauhinia variegata]
MDKDSSMKEATDLRNNVELARSVTDKHPDLLRPSARSYPLFRDSDKGKYTLIKDPEGFQQGIYDKPLPFHGCGIGWFSFLLGFLCPLMWYYGAILYFRNHHRKDPRERAGLGASAIAALLCSVALLIVATILLINLWSLRFQVQS